MIDWRYHSDVLRYDPESGAFERFLKRRGIWVEAGCLNAMGYRKLKVSGKVLAGHRLAWLIMYGELPDLDIDHINGDGSDNRICNLRLATKSQNMGNRKLNANNTSGFKGVSRNGNKWMVSIATNGKNKTIGRFNTPEEAHAAYVKAAQAVFGEFARPA